ncbi:MAG TPA: FKBP-type peptidyl-prolyl cis-trans isomerase [Ktedonobacteraceae bacterium]|nr:FKBP-type peptidyl-prolyl cis-trans isomerase [Ktedonobacteraceae bacterium]
MTQTVNGQKKAPQKQSRPGQRQQERLMRLERRRRRRRIWGSILVALVVIALSSISYWQYQRITTQINADRSAKATATTIAATATTTTKNCFVSPAGTQPNNIYSSAATPSAGPATAPHITGSVVTLKDGLKYVDIKTGKGTAAKRGSTVTVEYTGWLASTCKKFDSSYDRGGQPFSVALGQHQVIPGWDEGVVGMKPGGIRRLSIPPALAYGAQGQPPTIPANTTLIFDVTLLSLK